MTKKIEQEETCRQVVRDKDGRFTKGYSGNVNGNNQFTTIKPLIDALTKSAKKHKQDFWEFVAEKSRTSDSVLMAILKKLLPDKIQGEGFSSGTKIVVVYPKDHKKEENPRDEEVAPRSKSVSV